MSRNAIIGVDIGTTGCRAVIYNFQGRNLASQNIDYPIFTPQPTWAEWRPETGWHMRK